MKSTAPQTDQTAYTAENQQYHQIEAAIGIIRLTSNCVSAQETRSAHAGPPCIERHMGIAGVRMCPRLHHQQNGGAETSG